MEPLLPALLAALVVVGLVYGVSRWERRGRAPARRADPPPAPVPAAPPDKWWDSIGDLSLRVEVCESAVRLFRSELEDHYGKSRALEERVRKRQQRAAATADENGWEDPDGAQLPPVVFAPGAAAPADNQDPPMEAGQASLAVLRERLFSLKHPRMSGGG